jgi:GNAT superfamily N-acetyltransferase
VDAHPGPTAPDEARRAQLLAAYDDQLRELAEVRGATRWERDGPLLRAVFDEEASGGFGFVSYRDLTGYDGPDDGDRLDALIGRTMTFFAEQTRVDRWEWKTRGHDRPADLPVRLVAHGLTPEDVETVMVGEASLLAVDVPLPPEVTIRQVAGDKSGELAGDTLLDEVARVLAMQRAVFGSAGMDSVQSLARRIADPAGLVELWVAEAQDDDGGPPTVVCAGRLDLVPGTEFAGIWGGATLPPWRGRGIYRALTAARARSALAKGVRYLHSDCTAMSRPILARAGLVNVTTTTPYVWTRP